MSPSLLRLILPSLLSFLASPLPLSSVEGHVDAAQDPPRYEVASPDGSLIIQISPGSQLTYAIEMDGQTLVSPSAISLALGDGSVLGPMASVTQVRRASVTDTIRPVVPEKDALVEDRYEALSLDFGGGWGLDLRAYDDGVAYRFRVDRPGELVVREEEFSVVIPGNPKVWFPTEESFLTHSERRYEELTLGEIEPGTMASLPVLAQIPDGPEILLTESDLRDYPGLYLRGADGNSLAGVLPAYPALEEQTRDRTVRVVEREPYLALTSGPRTFPWRAFLVAEEDRNLVESTLVYRLAPPLQLEDPSWIKPGKVAWDWWNASSLHGVEFESGLNTRTYLYFIDFAADHGIEYIILDEGWSDPADLQALNPAMDLPALLEHAGERGVGIVLWVVWKTLEDEMEAALDRFARWGVAGVKVDFMQRDDQPMVQYYWRVAREAAERRLLVDFHGAYKPAGLRRAYPNVLTREGVMGLEHSKWSAQPTPEHNVTLPYIRMVAGPMDYTPGAMRNAQAARFNPIFDRPMSLGTRAHQMAMYVVFESPLQMLSDSPSNYLDEPECLAFLSKVPVVWDETRVLSGQVGDWIALARRKGDEWYVAAMTDGSERELDLDLFFLAPGSWQMESFADGPNAHRFAEDYQQTERVYDARNPIRIHMAPGGGWVARLSPGG